ncbi:MULTISPECIES: type II toxin-antitoxin system HicB family antitoxin [unclassified Pseudomonas]|uniref:type II toxin-antitoxin system HicB family antitoxin n=1 Tax=unclassified Pseudomonas TaxID=196821 RepID=UPI002115637A|nr:MULTISPECIES: type II toxin-antitoxin system HicB family antitoxin [unclassified Pseudomonas]
MYDYAIRFEQDDTGVAVFCRDLPELNSFGDDLKHAISEADDAIATTLSLYVDQRRVIPEATPPEDGEQVVPSPAVTVAKIALWNEMMKQGLRKADLCRALGVHQAQGDRLVDFLHTSKMEQLEAALSALRTSIRVSPSEPGWISLPYGGAQAGLYIERLVDAFQEAGVTEMPVGKTREGLAKVKRYALDFILRTRYARQPNTMQAVDAVLDQIVATGRFRRSEMSDPVTGKVVESIELI